MNKSRLMHINSCFRLTWVGPCVSIGLQSSYQRLLKLYFYRPEYFVLSTVSKYFLSAEVIVSSYLLLYKLLYTLYIV